MAVESSSSSTPASRSNAPRCRVGLPPANTAAAESFALQVILGFLIIQTLCQIALLVPQLSLLRVVFRTAAFAGSIGFLFLLPGKSLTPSWRLWLYGALGVYFLSFLHPDGNTPQAGIATILLNLAIFAPAFWVTRLRITEAVMSRALLFIWGFSTLSAGAGTLQVLYPGQFTGQISSITASLGDFADGLKITLADGQEIWRPTGLTDSPGGAAPAGQTAVLLSIAMLMGSRSLFLKSLCIASIGLGLFCIFLCQVRVVLVVLGIVVSFVCLGLFALGRYRQLTSLAAVIPALVVAVFLVATQYGGEKMTQRLESLIEENPNEVYGKNRGGFLESTYDEAFDKYPFGAGMGRWGMMNVYFGTPDTLWVEIQWTAWLYDGGLPLIICYFGAMLAALYTSVKVAMAAAKRDAEWLTGWAMVIAGYNFGTIALLFSYSPFIGQTGLEFWLLNGLLFSASKVAERSRRGVAA